MIIALYIVFFVVLIVIVLFYFARTKGEHAEIGRLKHKISELGEIDHLKQILLSSVSHQMRTPLSGAKWAIEAILKDENCTNRDLLEESHRRIEEAIGTVTEILKTSELDINKINIKIKKESFDVKALIATIIADLEYLVKAKKISLQYERYESEMALGDARLIRMALTNIFDNAFRYSPKGTVKINLFRSHDEIVLTVEDNGVGIDTNDLEFITFQKFYRGKNAVEIDPNESGVGLYTTRKIIELHGGRMALTSTLGKGTKVSITLPTA